MNPGMQYRPEYHLDRLRIMLDGDISHMKYRPEYQLDRLRMMMAAAAEGEQPLLHLPWLRTMVVDLSRTATADVDERLALHQRCAVGCAVERVVCKQLNADHLSRLLPFLTQSVSMLTSLDLRGCCSSDLHTRHFAVVADAHSSSLQRLFLPPNSNVTQSTLDRFTQLEELDATGCGNLRNVDFCSATLRVLYANNCHNLTDAGLRRATRLEVLHVSSCRQVTDVSPFAYTYSLLELDSSGNRCGMGSGALSDCRRLQVLNAYDNAKITTLQPFAPNLRELNAGWFCALNDAALSCAIGLVSLSAECNRAITTVEPFGASLRRLDASYGVIDDAGLVTATNLVYLNTTWNDSIRTLAPFSASLLELDASGWLINGITDAALTAATSLIWLNVSQNKITTLQSCGRSLRHLVVSDCALPNEGLSTATQLVTLDCRGNPNLKTIEPFLHSLEELQTHSEALCLEMERAPGFAKAALEGRWYRVPSAYAFVPAENEF